MPITPSASARPANATKSVVTDAGDATASETVVRMVCTSLTGISWLRLAMIWRSVASRCEVSAVVATAMVISAGMRPSSSVALRAVRHIRGADDPVGHVPPEVMRAHVPDDADDGMPVLLADEPELPADGARRLPRIARRSLSE